MGFKIKKSKKSKKWRGNSTYGHGARKKWKGSGHHGGCGMAGTGKRADHKKSLVIKLYGNNYFGKQGITSRSTERKINDSMNLGEIQKNLETLMKKYGKGNELVMERYKILGDGEFSIKLNIKARAASNSAKEKVEKNGGKIMLVNEKNLEKVNEKAAKHEEVIEVKNYVKERKSIKKE